MKTIRYAVVGLGHITQVAVLPAFKRLKKNSTLAALVTGSPKKAKAFSKQCAIVSYGEYDALLKSGTIDAVFIALPNHLHCDYAIRALDAGIHVLCEKPLALSQTECRRMIAASKRTGAKLMTAYRLHFDEPNLDAIRLCTSGKLGNLKTFVSAFSFTLKDKSNVRMNAAAGGGPLMDIGIYCINAVRYLFKENPAGVFVYNTRHETGPFSEVDESVTAVMRFSQAKTATFTCSFNSPSNGYYEVYGDKGMLRLDNAYDYRGPRELTTVIKEKKTKKKYKWADQFALEISNFSNCILKNKTVEPSGEEGLTDIAIIEAMNRSMESGQSESVDYAIEKTSTPKLQIAKPLSPAL